MEVSGRRDGDFTLSQSHSSDDVRLYCQPCKQEESWVPAFGYCQDCAEHLCKTCYRSHRKPAPCRNHILLDRTQMPQTQSSLPPTSPADLTERCEQHPGKLIKYYCQDHQILGCGPCMTMNHRTCKIDYIPEVSSKYAVSSEYQNLLQSLETLHENFKKIQEVAEENKNLILKNKETVIADIKHFRQEISLSLDKWEAEVYKEIEKVLSEESRKADSALKQSRKLVQAIETTQQSFEAVEHDGKVNMMYIQGKRKKESLHRHQADEQQMQQEVQVNTVTFQPNMAIKSLLQTQKTLGNIQINSRQNISLPGQQAEQIQAQASSIQKPLPEMKPPSYTGISAESSGQINVKTAKDRGDCTITGIAAIDTDKLAVADFEKNRSIKLIDVKKTSVISEIKLSSGPWDVVQLPGYQLAVSLPQEGVIQIVAYGNGLSKIRRLKAGGSCYGLAYSDGNLVVTYGYTTQVKIIGLNGTVLKTLYSEKSTSCFHYTTVDRNSGFIYISDYSSISQVLCLNKNGTVTGKFKHESLSEPCGLCMLEDGSILVCSSRNNICLISADLKSSKIILQEKDGLICPYSLAHDIKEKKLYIGSGKHHNYVNVYSYY